MIRGLRIVLCLAGIGIVLGGCSGSTGSTPPPGPSLPPPAASKISHIIVLVQENRSFDNLFAGFPGADTTLEGACKPAPWCPKSGEIALTQVTLESTGKKAKGQDICHSHDCFKTECDPNASNVCRMDGFDKIRYGETGNGPVATSYPYAYVERKETKPYWDFAKQYALADETFFNETASSFIAHQILISGTVELNDHESVTDQPFATTPWGCDSISNDNAPILYSNGKEKWSPGIFPCFTWATIADLLDAKHVSWLDYVDRCCQKKPYDFSGGAWNGFRAIKKIFHGPDWKTDISSPNTNIFTDITGGTLPSISWVIPTLYASDHPAGGCNGGPWWVTKVVDAVGTSQYWNSTAIILMWDDWGGWYDNAPPEQVDYHQLGFRVPMIVISPYVRAGSIYHRQLNFGSILKLMEQTFDLGSLGTADATAPSMEDVFDFNQTPTPFESEPIPKAMPCSDEVTNPKKGGDGMQEAIESAGGVPE
jgi:phospholipase C